MKKLSFCDIQMKEVAVRIIIAVKEKTMHSLMKVQLVLLMQDMGVI